MFRLEFMTDNAAFSPCTHQEVARILLLAAQQIENGRDFGYIRDSNGNKIGEYVLYGEENEE